MGDGVQAFGSSSFRETPDSGGQAFLDTPQVEGAGAGAL